MGSGLPPNTDAWRPAVPVTELVLRRLGRPRWLWIALWAMVPLISPLVFATAIRLSGDALETPEFADLVATQLVLGYVCLVFLWGTGVLGRQTEVLRPELAGLVRGDVPSDLFRRIGSIRGPLILTGGVAVIVSAGGWAAYGPLPPLAALPPLLVYLVPVLTFVWVYLAILVDLDRVGRLSLALDLFPQDPTLGLEKLGSIASTGLGLLLVGVVPVLLAGSDEPVTLGISLAVVGMTVALFMLSMWRLHRQMVTAKTRHVATARALYADAYAPIRQDPRIDTVVAQGSALSAAQSLDERAHNLPTWPLDEGTLRFIAVLVTGVLTSLIVRALFAAIGF